MEYDISLSYTQEPVTGSYHHRAESSTYPHILFTWEPTEYEYYPPVYAYVFQMCFPFRLKVKVKLSLPLAKHHAMVTYWGVEV